MMTIENLAGQMMSGFKDLKKGLEGLRTEMYQRFDEQNQKFKSIDQRFDEQKEYVDQQFDDFAIMMAKGFQEQKEEMNQRFDRVDVRFEEVGGRFTTLEEKVDGIRSDLNSLTFDHTKTRERVENLEVRTFGAIQAA